MTIPFDFITFEGAPNVFDSVDRPKHYASGGIEAVEAIESSMNKEAYRGFLKGNVIKYIWRYEQKNGLEDLKKCKWYLKQLIFALENDNEHEALNSIKQNCQDGFCSMPTPTGGSDLKSGYRTDVPMEKLNIFEPIHDS